MTHDQAVRLRLLVEDRRVTAEESPCAGRSIVVYGAKGGVGATTFALNLAVALSVAGESVELTPREYGRAAPCAGPGGVQVRAVEHWSALLRRRGEDSRLSLCERAPFRGAKGDSGCGSVESTDWIIIDGGVGAEWHDAAECRQAFLITTTEPASVLAAFAVLKESRAAGWWPDVIFNRVADEPSALRASERLQSTALSMLGRSLLTCRLPESPEQLTAAWRGQPVVLAHPAAAFTRQIRQLADGWLAAQQVRAA